MYLYLVSISQILPYKLVKPFLTKSYGLVPPNSALCFFFFFPHLCLQLIEFKIFCFVLLPLLYSVLHFLREIIIKGQPNGGQQ